MAGPVAQLLQAKRSPFLAPAQPQTPILYPVGPNFNPTVIASRCQTTQSQRLGFAGYLAVITALEFQLIAIRQGGETSDPTTLHLCGPRVRNLCAVTFRRPEWRTCYSWADEGPVFPVSGILAEIRSSILWGIIEMCREIVRMELQARHHKTSPRHKKVDAGIISSGLLQIEHCQFF